MPQIDHVKFTAPVRPGAQLAVHLAEDARGVGFEVQERGRAVARGRLLPG
jgi:3-hydroxymyristoyl/3-hydroxydecanoyl-(acyl carrier protein) dehydratase